MEDLILPTNLPSHTFVLGLFGISVEGPEKLRKVYIQLTESEAAFRALGMQVRIPPIFDQLQRRAKSCILAAAFLRYALCVTLRHPLICRGSRLSLAPATGS